MATWWNGIYSMELSRPSLMQTLRFGTHTLSAKPCFWRVKMAASNLLKLRRIPSCCSKPCRKSIRGAYHSLFLMSQSSLRAMLMEASADGIWNKTKALYTFKLRISKLRRPSRECRRINRLWSGVLSLSQMSIYFQVIRLAVSKFGIQCTALLSSHLAPYKQTSRQLQWISSMVSCMLQVSTQEFCQFNLTRLLTNGCN